MNWVGRRPARPPQSVPLLPVDVRDRNPEEVAAAAPGRPLPAGVRLRDRGITRELIAEAVEPATRGLLTVDLAVSANASGASRDVPETLPSAPRIAAERG
jgi:hypothetical protein